MAVSGWGQIYIQLDKGSYSPGQQVNGTIFLNLMNNLPGAQEVVLGISGMEATQLHERCESSTTETDNDGNTTTKTEVYYVTHTDQNSFFNHRFPVYTFSTPFIPMGQYSFPVSFILPSVLPSTFNYTFQNGGGANFAKVNYVMTAQITSSQVKANVLCTQNLVINQEQVLSTGTQKKTNSLNVQSCCCVDKGTTHMTTYFEKNDYVPGETAFMICEVDNSACSAPVLHIKGHFKQRIKILAKRYQNTVTLQHQQVIFPGVPAGKTKIGQDACRIALNLRTATGANVQPTCRGKLVSSEYSLHSNTQMDACLCCEKHPESVSIVTIRNADMEYQSFVAPSNWNPQLMGAYNAQFSSEYSAH